MKDSITTNKAAKILGISSRKINGDLEKEMMKHGIGPIHTHTSDNGGTLKFWNPAEIYRFKELMPTLKNLFGKKHPMKSEKERSNVREYVIENNAMLRALLSDLGKDPDIIIKDYYNRLPRKKEEADAGHQEER